LLGLALAGLGIATRRRTGSCSPLGEAPRSGAFLLAVVER
jgi:hypothetical protein